MKKSLKRKLHPKPYKGDTPEAILAAYKQLAEAVFQVLELDATDEDSHVRRLLLSLGDEIWNRSASGDESGFAFYQLESAGYWKAREFAMQKDRQARKAMYPDE